MWGHMLLVSPCFLWSLQVSSQFSAVEAFAVLSYNSKPLPCEEKGLQPTVALVHCLAKLNLAQQLYALILLEL